MKVTITIESNGAHSAKISCNPPVHKLKRMAQDGVSDPVIGMVGLALKKLFESAPTSGSIVMPGDDQAFKAQSAQARQVRKESARSKLINPQTGEAFA